MMPFYYGAKVRSVPEYLRLRFNEQTHFLNAATFAVATVLISGVNLYALALIMHLMLGWSISLAIVIAAVIVLGYITLGGLTSAIYNEVLQFFVIVASLLPLTIVALHAVGGVHGLKRKGQALDQLGDPGLHAWKGLGIHHVTNPLASDWIGDRLRPRLRARLRLLDDELRGGPAGALGAQPVGGAAHAADRRVSEDLHPRADDHPGPRRARHDQGAGTGSRGNLQYNTVIPHLIGNYLPEGMLGVAIAGLLAAFMAGVAANVTSFNTVVTYDLWQAYAVKDRDSGYYLKVGRLVTALGVVISVGTAFIAKGYPNIMNYIQTLFSIFNAPLFATFIIAMLWKRSTPWAGFWGLLDGYGGGVHGQPSERLPRGLPLRLGTQRQLLAGDHRVRRRCRRDRGRLDGHQAQARGGAARLVWKLTRTDERAEEADPGDKVWWRSPMLLGAGAIVLIVILNIIFI